MYFGEIASLWDRAKFSGKKSFEAMAIISESIRTHLSGEYKAATWAQPVLGGLAGQSILTSTVVALPVSKQPCLFQFDEKGSPEEATVDLPFVAVGSGQGIADPFLAFLRRLFWPEGLPSLADGIFAALWTLKHAIETAPSGIANPKQIVVLKAVGDAMSADELPRHDLDEHLQAIDAAETTLSSFRDLGSGSEPVGRAKLPEP
jgi:hypothetical protein